MEHLCLTLDDTSPYGLAAVDRRALESPYRRTLELWPKVDIYPGADEVPVTLAGPRDQPPNPPPSSSATPGTLGAGGGDEVRRPTRRGTRQGAPARGSACYTVETPDDAAFVLAVNTPGRAPT